MVFTVILIAALAALILTVWAFVRAFKPTKASLLKSRLDSSNAAKGKKGEKKVDKILKKVVSRLPNSGSVSDIMLGKSQIDHVLIVGDCVFCIETKNYSGTVKVETNLDKPWWIDSVSDNPVHNPFLQNAVHADSLVRYGLGKMFAPHSPYRVYSVIFLPGKSVNDIVVRGEIPSGHSIAVGYDSLMSVIARVQPREINVDNAIICKSLKRMGSYTEEDMWRHIEEIREKHPEKARGE
jgi:hypothetical protein